MNQAGYGNARVIDLVSDSETESPTPDPVRTRTRDVDYAVIPQQHLHREQDPPPFDFAPYLDDPFGFDFNDVPVPDQFPPPSHFSEWDEPPVRNHATPLVIDDFSYLDEDSETEPDQRAAAEGTRQDHDLALALEVGQTFTLDDCLQRVLEIFPDVSHSYVAELFNGHDDDVVVSTVRLDSIVDKLLSDNTYPRQAKPPSPLKRKRQESVDLEEQKRWERADRVAVAGYLVAPMRSMLKAEFPEFPQHSIKDILAQENHLYKGYLRLAHLRENAAGTRRGRPPVNTMSADAIAGMSGSPELVEELRAARNRVSHDRLLRVEELARKDAEAANLQAAIDAGETAECQACFDDLPMNRQIHCSGDTPHFTCFDCIETYIKSVVGESHCKVLCTAGCGSNFAYDQLHQLYDKELLEKLARLQQEKDIRDADLEDLEECPFCDFKAILPPIEEDFEFRCANPGCEKVSCRRCKAMSHIPISCEEHAKDNKLSSRHKIEEAMTAALVRSCNQCKKQFIKDYGCNKMTCPSCSNLQCYVCSQSLKDYNHFDQRPHGLAGGANGSKKCPLYDNVEERHEREVKAAEEAARAEVVAENPDVSAEDLKIKVSDAVEQSTQQRIQRNGPEGLGGGMHGWQDMLLPMPPLPPGLHVPGPEGLLGPAPRLHAMGNRIAAFNRARRAAAPPLGFDRPWPNQDVADMQQRARDHVAAMGPRRDAVVARRAARDEAYAALRREAHVNRPARHRPAKQGRELYPRGVDAVADRVAAQRNAAAAQAQAGAALDPRAPAQNRACHVPFAINQYGLREGEDEDDDEDVDNYGFGFSSSDEDEDKVPPPPLRAIHHGSRGPAPLPRRQPKVNLPTHPPDTGRALNVNPGQEQYLCAREAADERRHQRRAEAPIIVDDSPLKRGKAPLTPWRDRPDGTIAPYAVHRDHPRQRDVGRGIADEDLGGAPAAVAQPPIQRAGAVNAFVRGGRQDNNTNPFAPNLGQNQAARERQHNELLDRFNAVRTQNPQQGQGHPRMNFDPNPGPVVRQNVQAGPDDMFGFNPFPPAQDYNLRFRDPFNDVPALPSIEPDPRRNPDVRRTRQGFEHLEIMRQEHDERMGMRFRSFQPTRFGFGREE